MGFKMSAERNQKIKDHITNLVYKNGDHTNYHSLLQYGLDVLPVLTEYLTADLPINELEKVERILKVVLRSHVNDNITGREARDLALFQKEVGFLFKYKSYTIKAASPLGYSIFTQEQGEGFSFQQHLTHKTEIFHILEVHQGGYVFICEYADWVKFYDKEAFTKWLEGEPDDRYNQFRIEPKPGDLFVIDKLKVVHTVIGCILEEFATVSTDMVDRLHDQNAGKPIPPYYNRDYAKKIIRNIAYPTVNRHISIKPKNRSISEIIPVKIPGGFVTRLATKPVFASRYLVEPFSATECQLDERCAISIYISSGKGNLIIGENEEVKKLTPPAIKVSLGDLVMIPKGIYYAFVNEGPESLKITEHKIPFSVAFKEDLF
jgi:mannose-6-phosphate isomerase-like protein (cupin superfamily)